MGSLPINTSAPGKPGWQPTCPACVSPHSAGVSAPTMISAVLAVLVGAGRKIIGGWEVQPHSRPYMAFVKIETGRNQRNICGGFLIRKDVVVTAAHCNCNHLHPLVFHSNITVLLGAHNISMTEPRTQEIRVHRRIPHPAFNNNTLENDIMLLQLAQPVTLSAQVCPISLPLHGAPVIPGSVCSVAGWGQMCVFPGKTSDVLMEVDLEVIEDRICSWRFPNKYKPGTMLCGDSGGPLVCGGMAQGIVSFGPIDASPPQVYTRVSKFIPWINATVGNLQASDPLEFSPCP
uniref:Peptidase S1 domain-containing protein n=1 Tax=Chrysemys picta bellii TaxID=8478 RepID=A0A8C3FJ06_CHRPI